MNENMRDDYRLIIEGDKKRVVKQGDIKDKKYEPYICPRTGKPFDDKTRGPFWNFVRPHLKPKLMKSYDISIILEKEEYKENLDKLFHKCDIEYLYKEYFKEGNIIGGKLEKKLENLIGLIDLELLIILVKILREEATFEDYIGDNGEVESVEEESVEEVESVEEIETVSDENKEESVDETGGEDKEEIESVKEVSDEDKGNAENIEEKIKVLDLFCGCGGFTKGLEDAGLDVIAGIDHWNPAVESYKKNFNHICLEKDLTEYTPENFTEETGIKDIDLLVGGPPCQGFSMAGKRDKKDPRNSLFMEYVKYLSKICSKFWNYNNFNQIHIS